MYWLKCALGTAVFLLAYWAGVCLFIAGGCWILIHTSPWWLLLYLPLAFAFVAACVAHVAMETL